MDINTVATARHIDEQETSNDAACCAEAAENGFSPAQADSCEDGALNCVACPFRKDGGGERAQVAVFESIIWFSVAARMPDGDITVLLFDEDGDEPVWPGYFDGAEWIYVDGNIATPSHWANVPAGPRATT